MIGSGVSTDSMMAASFGLIDFTIPSISTDFNHFNQVVFIGDFGFPWWWGWGWGPWWGWGWGYPYGYYGGYTRPTVPVMDTAITVGLEWLNYRAGSLARAITMALSTESWDLRLGEQFGPTSATMDMQADLFLPAD